MRVRKLTGDGDYSFGSSQLDFWRDVPQAPAQVARTRLLLWLGEWFLNLTEGTTYPETVVGKHTKDLADTTIKDRVLGSQGVTNIQDYTSEIDPDTRLMTVQMTINTIYGPTDLEVSNYGNF